MILMEDGVGAVAIEVHFLQARRSVRRPVACLLIVQYCWTYIQQVSPSMAKVPAIIPITDFRQGAAAALDRVRRFGEPVVITQRGRAAAVMLSMEAYEQGERERQILRILAAGEREIAKGKGRDLAAVLAEADQLLHDADA